VTTPGFPVPPAPFAFPEPAVPASVVTAAGAGALQLPVALLQRTPKPVADAHGNYPMFLEESPPGRSLVSDPRLPAYGPLQLVFEGDFSVPGSAAEVRTGVFVKPGYEVEITASGRISVASILSSPVGPEGTGTTVYDVSYPLHGVALAPAYCLIAKLGDFGAWFYAGQTKARCLYAVPGDPELILGVNDSKLSDNSGSFMVHVRVWNGPEPPLLPMSAGAIPARPRLNVPQTITIFARDASSGQPLQAASVVIVNYGTGGRETRQTKPANKPFTITLRQGWVIDASTGRPTREALWPSALVNCTHYAGEVVQLADETA
jgi:hypothetical protein